MKQRDNKQQKYENAKIDKNALGRWSVSAVRLIVKKTSHHKRKGGLIIGFSL